MSERRLRMKLVWRGNSSRSFDVIPLGEKCEGCKLSLGLNGCREEERRKWILFLFN